MIWPDNRSPRRIVAVSATAALVSATLASASPVSAAEQAPATPAALSVPAAIAMIDTEAPEVAPCHIRSPAAAGGAAWVEFAARLSANAHPRNARTCHRTEAACYANGTAPIAHTRHSGM